MLLFLVFLVSISFYFFYFFLYPNLFSMLWHHGFFSILSFLNKKESRDIFERFSSSFFSGAVHFFEKEWFQTGKGHIIIIAIILTSNIHYIIVVASYN